MKKSDLLAAIAVICLGGFAVPSFAQYSVSVDMDPLTPGIQNTRIAAPGDMFTVDLVLAVGAAGVSSYGVSVQFDTGELQLNGAPAASVPALPSGLAPLAAPVESNALGQVYSFNGATFGLGPVSTSFIIGSVNFKVPLAAVVNNDGLADVSLGFFNVGVDAMFDNAGNPVAPVFNPGYVVPGCVLRILCPANFSVQCLSNVPACPGSLAAFLALGGTASDTCDTNLTYTCSDGPLTGGTCGGTITRTHTITDHFTNSASCVQVITVKDTIPPIITCPSNITVQCLSNVPACPISLAAFRALGGTASDNCDTNLTYTCSDGPLTGGTCGGTIARRHTVTDDCTNSASCVQVITVKDTVPPIITCPSNIIVQCLSNVPACPTNLAAFRALGGTASDNCDTNLTYTCSDGPLTGGTCGGTIARTHTVTDDCTNSASCVQVITVKDTVPPIITCPSNITVQCLSNVPACPTNLAAFRALGGTASDNCDTNLTYTCSDGPLTGGTCGGTIARTHTVTDDCTNSASCVQVITVKDTVPPIITCPSNITVQCLSNVPACPTSLAAFRALGGTASDNCDTNLTYTCSDGPLTGGTCGGTIARTHTVTDDCTNSASCVQVITVKDTVPPIITCPSNLTVQCLSNVPACPTSLAAFRALGGTASDNCDTNLTYTCSDGPLTGGLCGGTIARRHTVTDDCTNSASCVQVITVKDTIPPIITCPSNITVQCLSNVPACPTNLAAFRALGGTASDNCDTNLTYTCSDGPLTGGTCGGTIARTHTVTDDCTNSASCVQVITVKDTIPPIITCPSNITVQCLSNVPPCPTSLAAFRALGGTASDNCDTNLTYICSDGPLTGGTCGGTIARRHTVTDDCTNSASCVQVITVKDTIPPIITCPSNITVQCLSNVPACPTTLAAFRALGGTASDNCDTNLTYTCSDGPLTGGICGGTIARRHTVTDDCTNSASCVQVITVKDTVPPIITCPSNITVQCLSNVPACPTSLAAFRALGGTASDNCDTNLTYTCSDGPLTGGTCGGTIARTHTVTDDCTNSASCVQVITVKDTVPPIITCPSNITVQCLSNVPACPTSLAAFRALGGTASDNCDTNLTYTCSDGPLTGGTCGGTIARRHTVTDDCTNSASCVQVITVKDTVPPIITCPSNITVQCLSNVPPCPTTLAAFRALGGTASDNCDTNLTYTCSDGPLTGGICGGTIARRHTVTDDCTNSASCVQVITVKDTVPPIITCPSNITVRGISNVPPCPTNLAAFRALGGTASDNCDTNLTYTCSDGPFTGGPCSGTIARTHTVTDDCTNSASCVQVITVNSNVALSIQLISGGTSVRISWSGAGFTLQGTPVLANPGPSVWTCISGSSPVVLPNTLPYRFFRLSCPCP